MSDRGGSTARPLAAGALTVGALGVVFGDIGTSPLYALHVAFSTTRQAGPPDHDVVYGVVSLVFWTITLVVSVKYVVFILRADNEGEGGVLALLALVRGAPRPSRARVALLTLGLFGAALFYGDGMITPAVSVLSAVEGLRVAEPGLDPYVVPVALAVLIVLFGVQRFGTGTVGSLFGPVMALWFAAIAVAGLHQVARHPEILTALSPAYGVRYLFDHAGNGLVVLGAVALTVTGAEALYADMGHFGRAAVRRAWLCIVFPALVLNYAGQGALVLSSHGAAAGNPFFLLVPSWGRLPMVALATAATVIASQAVISGAFSITHQAIQLGLLPRLRIRHTSERQAGQVYVPAVNAVLCLAVIALVVGFGSSAGLASAYGIAVTGTMTITTILFCDVVRARWGQPLAVVLAGGAALLSVDVALFAASLTKLSHGGWLPLGVALGVFTVLTTFSRGRGVLERVLTEQEGSLRRFVEEVRAIRPPVLRPPQTSVFLHGRRDTAPLALRANLRHNHVVHRSVLIVLVETASVPHVAPSERVTVDDLGYRDDGITNVTARFGFHDRQDVPRALALVARADVEAAVDVGTASYFMSRIAIVATDAPTMRPWRKHLFIAMWRNQADSVGYLGLPDDRTVLMGSMVEL